MRPSSILGVSRLLLLLVPSLLSITASAEDTRTCFMVDEQTTAVDDVPCTTDEITHCCNKKDVCMSNGLCYVLQNGAMSLSRGSCTDKQWGGFCQSARPCALTNQKSGYPVVNADVGSRTFCCGAVLSSPGTSPDEIDCAVDSPFKVPSGTPIAGVAALSYLSSSTSSPSSTSNATHAIGSAEPSSEKSNDQSTRLAIGLALGLPLGIIAGTALIWGAWERRQRASAAKEVENLKAAMTQNYGYAPVAQMQGPPPVEMGHSDRVLAELPQPGHKG